MAFALGLSGASASGPGYSVGTSYTPVGLLNQNTTGSTIVATTTMASTAWWLPDVGYTWSGSGSVGDIILRAIAAGTTTVQVGIYATNYSAIPYRPWGAPLGVSNAVSTTSGQPIPTFSPTAPLASNNLYWTCLEAGDTTFKYATIPGGNGVGNSYLNFVGTSNASFTGQNGSAPMNGIVTTVTSYGTWPTFTGSTTWTETSSQGPWFAFGFSSIP
ncbi:MAG: hypothetical protein JO051_00875 [Acidobacteriaceae bacterium]|nr:hypothetical protein [Acidobacteriaceae bacterium]